MIDTQRIRCAPRCVAGVAEVAAVCASRESSHRTHALDVAAYFPLDVETISRMLEAMTERDGVAFEQDVLTYLHIDQPQAFHVREVDIERGEHLETNNSLIKHLSELRSDEAWLRKVMTQHELLRIAAEARDRTLELGYFTSRSELPSARIQSVLNDLGAEGHILVEVDDESESLRYTFPKIDYPKARYLRHISLLKTLPPQPRVPPMIWALVAVVLALAVFGLTSG